MPADPRLDIEHDEAATAQAHTGSWRDHAECKGRTTLFFPRRAERPEARERRETQADRLCARCDVAQPCRDYARSHHEYGFWAGESEEDRHRLGYTVSAPIGVRIRPASRAV
jgi:WhiB family redox-sensing transcriptional regulator